MAIQESSRLNASKRRRRLVLFLAVALSSAYLVSGALLINPYLTNADAVSYISIAQKYARGDFANALNGYWSPLLSWLLVPPILAGADPIVAAKVLNLLAGLGLAFGIFLLGRRFDLPDGLRFFVAGLSLPIILFRYALGHIAPDLILAVVLVYYLFIVFDPSFFQQKRAWLWSGLLGAAAFFAKSYAFFFFLAHFSALSLFHLATAQSGASRRGILRKAGGAIFIFLILSGMQITALSLKYGHFTISTAGRIAFSLHAPESGGHFTTARHLVSPPNPTAVSAWEDPSLRPPAASWKTLRTEARIRHFLSEIGENFADAVSILRNFSLWIFIVLPAAAVLSFWPRRHRPAGLALATLGMYDAGYFIVGVNPRYLYLNEVLILLLGGYAFGLLLRVMGLRSPVLKAGLALAFALPFILTPYTLSAKFRLEHENLFAGRNAGPGPAIYRSSLRVITALAAYEPAGPSGRKTALASDAYYQNSLILAYYGGHAYYGLLPSRETPEVAEQEIKEKHIDYVILWELLLKRYPFLKDCPKVPCEGLKSPRIYDVRPLWQKTSSRGTSPQPRRIRKTSVPRGDEHGPPAKGTLGNVKSRSGSNGL